MDVADVAELARTDLVMAGVGFVESGWGHDLGYIHDGQLYVVELTLTEAQS